MGLQGSKIITLDQAQKRLSSSDFERYSSGFDSMTANTNHLLDKPAFMDYVLGRGSMGKSNSTISGPGSGMPVELAERIFSVFNTTQSGYITKSEFLCGMAIFKAGTAEERLKFIFHVYDEDNSGFISREEIQKYLTVLRDTTPTLSGLSVQQKVEKTFDEADTNKDQRLSFDEFKSWAQQNMMPGLITWIWQLNNGTPPLPQPAPIANNNNNKDSNSKDKDKEKDKDNNSVAATANGTKENSKTNSKTNSNNTPTTNATNQPTTNGIHTTEANGADKPVTDKTDNSATPKPETNGTIITVSPVTTIPDDTTNTANNDNTTAIDVEAAIDGVPPMLSLWRGRCKSVAAITHFNEKEITELEKQYHRIRAVGKTVDTQTLSKLFSPALPGDLLQRIFSAFISNNNNNGSNTANGSNNQTIDVREFICGLSSCCRGTQEEKLKFVFRIFDENNDDKLDRQEMQNLLSSMWKITAVHSNLTDNNGNSSNNNNPSDVQPLVNQIFEQFDLDRDENISYGEFKVFTQTNPSALFFFNKIREFASIHLGVKPTEPQQEKDIMVDLVKFEISKEKTNSKIVPNAANPIQNIQSLSLTNQAETNNNSNNNNNNDKPNDNSNTNNATTSNNVDTGSGEETYFVLSMRWLQAWCCYVSVDINLFKSLSYQTTDSFQANKPSNNNKAKSTTTSSKDDIKAIDASPISPGSRDSISEIDINVNLSNNHMNAAILKNKNNLRPSAIDNSDILTEGDANRTNNLVANNSANNDANGAALPPLMPSLQQQTSILTANPSGSNYLLQLKPNLIEFQDYIILSESIWNPLYAWYGVNNGQIIKRKRILVKNTLNTAANSEANAAFTAIATANEYRKLIELYPYVFYIKTIKDINLANEKPDPKKANSNSSNNNNNPVQPLLSVSCSRLSSLLSLKQKICAKLNQPIDKMRAWDCFDPNNPRLLEPDNENLVNNNIDVLASQLTVEDALLQTGQCIFMELQLENGRWPGYPNNNNNNHSASSVSNKGKGMKLISQPNAGLVGLYNLGNTCFMAAAVQCLSFTLPLTQYFLGDFYARELNTKNPLGMQGKLAIQYAKLLKQIYSTRPFDAIAPRNFKYHIGKYRAAFNGNQQQDAQELLSFVLDGLHEDLNRVQIKPYVPDTDSNNRPDIVVANEHWNNHLKRHQSVIVDLFTGLFKNTLKFSCGRTSVKFDPYTSLSLPLPKQKARYIEITVIFALSSRVPQRYSIEISLYARITDLKHALSQLCGVPASRLQLADVYKCVIFNFLVSYQTCSDIRAGDDLYAYETPVKPKNIVSIPVVEPPPVQQQPLVTNKPADPYIRVGYKLDVLDSVKKWLVGEILAIRIQSPHNENIVHTITNNHADTNTNANQEATRRVAEPTTQQTTADSNNANDNNTASVAAKQATESPQLGSVRFIEDESEQNNNSLGAAGNKTTDLLLPVTIHSETGNQTTLNPKQPNIVSEPNVLSIPGTVESSTPPNPTVTNLQQNNNTTNVTNNAATSDSQPNSNADTTSNTNKGDKDSGWTNVDTVPTIMAPGTMVQLLIHYEGWSNKWDEWITQNSYRLAPLGSQSTQVQIFNKRRLRHRNEELDIDPNLICIHAVHRQIEKIENYFLHPATAVLFGTPILLFVDPATTTYADLYKLVWEKSRRFTSYVDDNDNNCEPFVLKYVNRNGTACSKCNWLQMCLGCSVIANNSVLGSKEWINDIQIGIDWNPVFLSKYFNFNDMNDVWFDESVNIHRKQLNTALSVADCMAMFTAPETLEGDAQVYCSQCKQHENATKTLELWNTPNILVVHLKRLTANGKLYTLVDCPLKGFDPTPFLAIPDKHLQGININGANTNNNNNENNNANSNGDTDASSINNVNSNAAQPSSTVNPNFNVTTSLVGAITVTSNNNNHNNENGDNIEPVLANNASNSDNNNDDGTGLGLEISNVQPVIQATPSKSTKALAQTNSNHNNNNSSKDFSTIPPNTPSNNNKDGNNKTKETIPITVQVNAKYADKNTDNNNNNNTKKPDDNNKSDEALSPGAMQNHDLYDLFASVNHLGASGGGHYTACCKHKKSNKWFKFDDNFVSEINESGVINSATYMLFYEKRKQNNNNNNNNTNGAASPTSGNINNLDFLPPDIRQKLMGSLNDEQKANLKEISADQALNPCCSIM